MVFGAKPLQMVPCSENIFLHLLVFLVGLLAKLEKRRIRLRKPSSPEYSLLPPQLVDEEEEQEEYSLLNKRKRAPTPKPAKPSKKARVDSPVYSDSEEMEVEEEVPVRVPQHEALLSGLKVPKVGFSKLLEHLQTTPVKLPQRNPKDIDRLPQPLFTSLEDAGIPDPEDSATPIESFASTTLMSDLFKPFLGGPKASKEKPSTNLKKETPGVISKATRRRKSKAAEEEVNPSTYSSGLVVNVFKSNRFLGEVKLQVKYLSSCSVIPEHATRVIDMAHVAAVKRSILSFEAGHLMRHSFKVALIPVPECGFFEGDRMKKFIASISELSIDKRAAPIEEALEKSAFIALTIGGDHSREAFQQIVRERQHTGSFPDNFRVRVQLFWSLEPEESHAIGFVDNIVSSTVKKYSLKDKVCLIRNMWKCQTEYYRVPKLNTRNMEIAVFTIM